MNGEDTETTQTNRLRVLVVDDEPNMRNLLEGILEHVGFEVDSARDGEEGLGFYMRAKEGQIPPYNLIMTDCDMPRMDGIEFMRSMKQRGNGTPVVLSSGRREEDTSWQREGFVYFLAKPYTFEQLVECARQYAEGEDNPQ
jgi:CheY-like chemotaxis protein